MVDGARLDLQRLEDFARLATPHVRLQQHEAAQAPLVAAARQPAAHIPLDHGGLDVLDAQPVVASR